MNERRIGPWMGMAGGRKFWPLDPRAREVEIDDIATALSNLCRFGGRVSSFYSVAQHSVWVAEHVEQQWPNLALHALLHDSAEAYVGDVIRPIKDLLWMDVSPDGDSAHGMDGMEHFSITEARVLRAIHERFSLRQLDFIEKANIKLVDDLALATEARDLMGDPRWPELCAPHPERIVPVAPRAARSQFLQTFARLTAAEVATR